MFRGCIVYVRVIETCPTTVTMIQSKSGILVDVALYGPPQSAKAEALVNCSVNNVLLSMKLADEARSVSGEMEYMYGKVGPKLAK